MDALHEFIRLVIGYVTNYGLVPLLLIAGLVFLVLGRGMQFRTMGLALRVIAGSRSGHGAGISSFQAFCISLASRVGTGNIAGVAIALAMGGPGAIFWMWVMALLGMGTAFVEATLAQIYKQPHPDGTFRGGPAFYMQRGLGSRPMGMFFAVCLIFAFGLAFNMVQANTIADVVSTHGIEPWVTAVVLVVLVGVVVIGGIRSVARVTEYVAPLMALLYVLLAVVIIVVNIQAVPDVIADIFRGAFGLDEALAGTAGGMLAALLNGVRRGMFSNEAGMGSAPNAAATATVSHPAHQGLLQSVGVFVDTIIICTATATMILLAPGGVYTPGVTTRDQAGASLTQDAIAAGLGDWTLPLMSVLIFVFAFSSVLGNSTYAEVNMDFLGGKVIGDYAIRILVVVAVGVGAIAELGFVWDVADLAMSLMAIINLFAILLLGKHAFAALRHLQTYGKNAPHASYVLSEIDETPKGVVDGMWPASPGADCDALRGASSTPAARADGHRDGPVEGR